MDLGHRRARFLTPSEFLHLALEPFFPPLYLKVRRRLLEVAREMDGQGLMLDVGCRTSPYTIGVRGRFVLSDLPKKTELQQRLYLGLSGDMVEKLHQRRSNIVTVVFDDMTQSSFRAGRFDCVSAIEVLEHVERDGLFVSEVHRVLKNGGAFVMSTPNGDHVSSANIPDHKRHYTRAQLHDLLAAHFASVEVHYAIRSGKFFQWGHDSWSLRNPLKTARIMAANFLSLVQSSGNGIANRASGAEHLIAIARKE